MKKTIFSTAQVCLAGCWRSCHLIVFDEHHIGSHPFGRFLMLWATLHASQLPMTEEIRTWKMHCVALLLHICVCQITPNIVGWKAGQNSGVVKTTVVYYSPPILNDI